ncbi:MAG: polymorphic toxin type 50 domain-containing protein [Ruthenibacterium sp.]
MCIDQKKGTSYPTNLLMISYSKKGAHIYPRKEE